MQHNIKSLIGYRMEATDGDIGKVKEFYFVDTTWLIRYIILETGNWLLQRKVLIAPQAIIKGQARLRTFPVNLSKDQIRTSPDIDTDKPVSRQQDMELYGHYAWQWYGSGFYAGGLEENMDINPIIDEKIMKESDSKNKTSEDDLHLRSTKELIGYHIHSTDGDDGRVDDFILDEAHWQITYLVVYAHALFGGKKLLIETGKIKEIQWENSKVIVNISTKDIEDLPPYDEAQFELPQ